MKATRNTYQREMVKQAIATLANHPSADEIYEFISVRNSHISKGTVYRNLTILSEQGEILRIEIANGPDRFDHNAHNHYHLKCAVCGRVRDSSCPYHVVPQSIIDSACDDDGFIVDGYSIIFSGKCNNCKAKETTYFFNLS